MTLDKERTFLETTDEYRHAACFLAGYQPGETHRIIPVRQCAPELPKETPEDRESDMVADPERVACGRVRRTYADGTVYGYLRIVSSRDTKRGGGRRYVCKCERCGTVGEYAGSEINLADRRGSRCKACRNKKASRDTRVAA